MSEDVLKEFAGTIWVAYFHAGRDFVPFEGSPSTEDFCIVALADELRTQQARVAELEGDAKLGKMVWEMPEGAELCHVVMTSGRTLFTYSEPRPKWGLYTKCARNGDTAAEAIEKVRSKP